VDERITKIVSSRENIAKSGKKEREVVRGGAILKNRETGRQRSQPLGYGRGDLQKGERRKLFRMAVTTKKTSKGVSIRWIRQLDRGRGETTEVRVKIYPKEGSNHGESSPSGKRNEPFLKKNCGGDGNRPSGRKYGPWRTQSRTGLCEFMGWDSQRGGY